jgi:hypothetical protein
MTWFQKFLGLGKTENTVLTIKLRLNRWRHFLRTEWACALLLDDLEEKSRGEYIFDRQYVYSTVGRIFQKAYQMAYDGTLLLRNPEREFYDLLDDQKEKTQSYLSQYSKGGRGSETAPIPPAASSDENSRVVDSWQTELNLDQEPEFIMLKGVIALLDRSRTQEKNTTDQPLEAVKDLRTALRWLHEKVLRDLINPEIVGQWVKSGLAVSCGETPAQSYTLIDLGQASWSGTTPSKQRKSHPGAEKPLTTWPVIQGVLTVLTKNVSGISKKNGRTLCFIINENALFLFGFDSEDFIWLDMVLTHVRELNHFLFRCQKRSENIAAAPKTPPTWEWTYQEEGKIYEFVAFQKSPREIENFNERIGRALGQVFY